MKSILTLNTLVASRRRFLGMLGGVAASVLALPRVSRAKSAPVLSTKEAAFYRDSNGDEMQNLSERSRSRKDY